MRSHVFGLAALCLVLAGCDPPSTVSPSTTPTGPSAAAPTAPPAATPTPQPASAPTTPPQRAQPPQQTVAATSSSASGNTSTSGRTASSAGATTLKIDPANSKASYHAHERLVTHTLPSEAVGTSMAVAGSIVLNADGSIADDQSRVTVDLRQLKSDESRRDNFIKGDTLQTNRYPMATFVPRSVDGLPSPLPSAGQMTFQLSGDLTVHDVTRAVTWQVTAQFGAANVQGSATTTVNISDFGMTPPKAGPVLSIEDALQLELVFDAAREA